MSDSDNQDVKWNAEFMMDNARSLQRVVEDIERNTTAVFGIGPAPFHRTTTGSSNPIVIGDGNRTEGTAVLGKKQSPCPDP